MGFGIHIKDGDYHKSWSNPFGIKGENAAEMTAIVVIGFFRALAQPVIGLFEIGTFYSTKDIVAIEENGKKLRGTCKEKIAKGACGIVYKVEFSDSEGNKVLKAVKKLNRFDLTDKMSFEREAFFHEKTKTLPPNHHVANGGHLVKKKYGDSLIVMDFFEEGDSYHKRRDFVIGKTQIEVFKKVIEACLELEKLNFFHIDIKPDNLFLRNQALYAGDLGGIAFFPPYQELDAHLGELIEVIKNASPNGHPDIFYKPIETLTQSEKIKLFYYCTSSKGQFTFTPPYGSWSLHTPMCDFKKKESIDNPEVEYNELRAMARKQLIRECAATALSFFCEKLNKDDGILEQNDFEVITDHKLRRICRKMADTTSRVGTLQSFYDEIVKLEATV